MPCAEERNDACHRARGEKDSRASAPSGDFRACTLLGMRLPKWAVPAVGAIIVGGAIAARYWNEVEEKEKARAEAREAEQAGVRITARLGEPCAEAKPIRITVKNTTTRTVKTLTFHLGVYEEGRVGDLDPGSPDESWTLVLAPGAEESRCSAASVPVGPHHVLKPERRGTNKVTFFEKGERR